MTSNTDRAWRTEGLVCRRCKWEVFAARFHRNDESGEEIQGSHRFHVGCGVCGFKSKKHRTFSELKSALGTEDIAVVGSLYR